MRDFINNYWENSGFTLNLKPWCDNLICYPHIGQ